MNLKRYKMRIRPRTLIGVNVEYFNRFGVPPLTMEVDFQATLNAWNAVQALDKNGDVAVGESNMARALLLNLATAHLVAHGKVGSIDVTDELLQCAKNWSQRIASKTASEKQPLRELDASTSATQ